MTLENLSLYVIKALLQGVLMSQHLHLIKQNGHSVLHEQIKEVEKRETKEGVILIDKPCKTRSN